MLPNKVEINKQYHNDIYKKANQLIIITWLSIVVTTECDTVCIPLVTFESAYYAERHCKLMGLCHKVAVIRWMYKQISSICLPTNSCLRHLSILQFQRLLISYFDYKALYTKYHLDHVCDSFQDLPTLALDWSYVLQTRLRTVLTRTKNH